MVDEAGSPAAAVGRILVLLDGSPLSRSALAAAAEIAHQKGAPVLGIFVDDTNLIRSAGYGFAREVGGMSGQIRPVDRARLQARMDHLAREAALALGRVTSGRGMPQELIRCRGQVVSEVRQLARSDDLLILGRVGWSGGPGARLGSTARALLRDSPGEVLLWTERPRRPRGRVVVLINHDQAANQRVLQVGAELARWHHQPLTVLVRGRGDDGAVPARLRTQLQALGAQARIRVLAQQAPTLADVLAQENASHLVVSRGSRLLADPAGDSMLASLDLALTVTP